MELRRSSQLGCCVTCVLCLFIVTFTVECSTTQDIFFIARRRNDAVCVSNSPLAMAWNTKRALEGPEGQASFYKKSPNILDCVGNPANCDTLLETWNLTKSLDSPLYQYLPIIITDHRWQDLKEFRTGIGYTNVSDPNYVETYIQNSRRFMTNTFELPMSFRGGSEAQIFICTSLFPLHLGECYMFRIEMGNTSSKNTAKVCKDVSNFIYKTNFSHTYCSRYYTGEIVPGKLQLRTSTTRLNGKLWNHFTLLKHSGYISLWHLKKSRPDIMLRIRDEFNDKTNSTVVLVNSGPDGGLWRFHEYKFFYTTEENTATLDGSPFKPHNGTIYLSIFAAVCRICEIKFKLVDGDSENEIPCNVTRLGKTRKAWNKIIISAVNVTKAVVYLEITTKLKEPEAVDEALSIAYTFWAIDSLQQRNDSPAFNMVHLRNINEEEDSCQLLLGDVEEIDFRNRTYRKVNNYTCSSENSTQFCAPCEWIFDKGNCSEIKLCQKTKDKSIECLVSFSEKIELGHFFLGRGYYYLILIPVVILPLLVLAIFLFIKQRARWLKKQYKKRLSTQEIIYPDSPVSYEYKKLEENVRIPEPVDIAQFESYVHESEKLGEIAKQLNMIIPANQPFYCEVLATQSEYYEQPTGIVFIDGYKAQKAFIAIQDQDEMTLSTFWKRVCDNDVENVVFLSSDGNEESVNKYFPGMGTFLVVDEIKVEGIYEKCYENYKYRLFKLQSNQPFKEIKLFSFAKWTSHIPLCAMSLKEFVANLLLFPLTSETPILFMDSNGKDLTRIAAVILSDSSLRMAAREGVVDVFKLFKKLHEKLPISLHNFTYYTFVHHVVVESIFHFNSEIKYEELKILASEDRILDSDWIKLQTLSAEILVNTQKAIGTLQKHKIGNLVVPTYGNLPHLDAVYVNSFRTQKKFIVVKEPKVNTLDAFWRITVENDVSLVITLNQYDRDIWFKHAMVVGYMTNKKVLKSHDVMVMQINCGSFSYKKPSFTLTIVSLKYWHSTEDVPKELPSFLNFWKETNELCNNSSRVVVMCKDGVTACGIYVALSFLIDRMRVKHVCDVSKAVTSVRQSNDKFIKQKQFPVLYEAAVIFLETEK